MSSTEVENFSQLFPLFNVGSQEALASMLSVAWRNTYPAGRAILIEDAWGNAVYFILSGWVKVRRLLANGDFMTLAILGPGDFFGEMAILDQSPRSTDVVALCPAEVLSVPAQKFVHVLRREPDLHYRMLQLMAQRLRQTNARIELLHQPPAVKLAHVLVNLARRYGQQQEANANTAVIFNVPVKDLADVASIGVEEAQQLLNKLVAKNWLKIDAAKQELQILSLPQLEQLAQQAVS
ncbi:MAG: Crp/Fnr family transcriptional regulator [Thermosynechococcus sp. Uc]|uniref:Crp/Fnr family transcriptional regulator n=1 Tax=Thermosynechococcus sp. Uc TaxID=3034853 RepID=UPI0019FDC8AC|nr:Crp/Fnr family transcriptional regulator [Thermosynechococcus sp. Uc]MDM7326502.1 Crp/Fnr family transcriptional regulator [Thermosynechococcus sp. Uc]HIK26081.1 Crp/Fnr family transcriptional regulator [Thermosynechococcus sp. M46_R2017_013]